MMAAAKKKTKAKRKKKLRMLPLSRPVTPQDIIDRTRQYGPACVEALADEVANGAGMARVAAVREMLDRAIGKAGQKMELSGDKASPLVIKVVRFSEDEVGNE